MKICCGPYTWSALSPIKATDTMTHPVGQRDGQLFTEPTGGVPEPTEAQNGYILQVIGGTWQPTNAMAEALAKINGNIQSIAFLQNRVSAIETELEGVRAAVIALNGEVV